MGSGKLIAAVDKFLEAFCAYQEATLKINLSLERLNRNNYEVCDLLKGMIRPSGPAFTRLRPGR